jgi:hypothetical protein
MKYTLIALVLVLTGCSHTQELESYLNTQKSMNRDSTVIEAAKINALRDIAMESKDITVKIEAIKGLQQIQKDRTVVIEQPKKNWFGF